MTKLVFTLEGMVANAELLLVGAPLVLFGLLCSYLVGVRDRLLLVGSATAVGVGSLVLTAQLVGTIGIALSLPALMAVAVVIAGAIGLAARLISARRGPATTDAAVDTKATAAVEPEAAAGNRRWAWRPSQAWPAWVGAAAGALLGLAAWLPAISKSGAPAQNVDDIWHGFLTARVGDLDVITASAMSPVMVDRAEPTTFYPYGLHVAAAAIRSVTGVEVPVALNAMWAVAVGVMLPFGVAALVYLMLPSRPWAAGYAAMAASALQFFPYVLAGIQPYALGLALVPGAVALLVYVARSSQGATAAVSLAVASAGVLVTHPAAAAVLVITGGLVVIEVFAADRRVIRPALLRLVGVAVTAGVFTWPFIKGQADRAAFVTTVSTTVSSIATAVRQAVVFQTPWTVKASALSAFVLIGIAAVAARRFRGWSFAAAYAVFFIGYVAALTGQTWVTPFVGPWYGEWWRLMGAVVLVSSPLVGIGAEALQHVVLMGVAALRRSERSRLVPALFAVGGLLAMASLLLVLRSTLSGQSTVAGSWSPKRVTGDDISLFRQVRPHVQSDETVLNFWVDGSGAMYAIAGLRPLSPYAFSSDSGLNLVYANLAALRKEDCAWLVERKAGYALAKHTTLDGVPNPILAGLAANTAVFKPTLSTPSGTAYKIDGAVLARCAAGEVP